MIKIIIAVSYNDNDIKNSMSTENSNTMQFTETVNYNTYIYIRIMMNATKTKYITTNQNIG